MRERKRLLLIFILFGLLATTYRFRYIGLTHYVDIVKVDPRMTNISQQIEDCVQRKDDTNAKPTGAKKHVNKTLTTDEIDSAHVPDVIFQFGMPRTATTLQFQILCTMMVMLHEHEANKVGCDYDNIPNTKYKVIKHHKLDMLAKVPEHSWLFMTTGSNAVRHNKQLRSAHDTMEAKHIVVPYVANFSLILKRGRSIIHEYQKFFGLSDSQMEHIADYFKYWEILRICCGRQMSKNWRSYLQQEVKTKQNDSQLHVKMHSCAMYNISLVENMFMETYIYRTFSNIESLQILARPANNDGRIDGNYCTACNENIASRNIEFNGKCV